MLRAEPVALGAQHAAEAPEAPRDAVAAAALPDAELEAAVQSDAELAEAAEQVASPVEPERPSLAADHPSAALPFPFRAPWFHPAAAPPPLVRFAHARQSLQTASQ